MPANTQDFVANLPTLDAAGVTHEKRAQAYLASRIEAEPYGYMPFEQWMDLALYAPELGYYAGGSEKLGTGSAQGDFVTAPELSPLFGQTVALQVAQVLRASGSTHVLEFGAGSGALAASVIPALRAKGIAPTYHILDVSANLRERQRQRLAPFGQCVRWLDTLPDTFSGCVLANEVLDAMPVTLFRWADDGTVLELGVSLSHDRSAGHEISFRRRHSGGIEASLGRTPIDDATPPPDQRTPFVLTEKAAPPELRRLVMQRMPAMPGYQSEINRRGEAWMRQLGAWLERGAALIIDYGFPRHEYYHPQRDGGTLMCHFRHRAHDRPLILAGLQDITAHVDFTAMADAALEGGLDVLGYTSQARFLLNAGLTTVIEDRRSADSGDSTRRAAELAAVQQLVSEAEMGELFKVLAVGRGLDTTLLGFTAGDRRNRL
ncbi:MAG: class I SAM-dependent methyltransferase [Candidimonas sp.]|nr:MAG: class I SAM-dependent methyltransferase [Candidimonas sp.]